MRKARVKRPLAALVAMLLAAGCAATAPGGAGGEDQPDDQFGALARFRVTGNVRMLPGQSSASETFRLQFIDTGLDLLTRGEDRVMRSFALGWGESFTLAFDYFWTAREPEPKRAEIAVEVSAPGCRGLSLPVHLDRLAQNEEGAYLIELDLEIGPCDAPK